MPMIERMKLCYQFALDLCRQLLTLATAIVTLTVAFLKDILKEPPLEAKALLVSGWFLELLSILLGIVAIMALTGNLVCTDEDHPPLEPPVTSTVRYSLQGQIATFLLGLASLAACVFTALK